MALLMARPTKNKYGIYQIRLKVPADIRRLRPDAPMEVGKSLDTRDPEEAKTRFAVELAAYRRGWDAIRNGPQAIPLETLVAISGVHYRELSAMVEIEPGEPEVWQAMVGLHERLSAAEGRADALEQWYGSAADELLSRHGLIANDHSRSRFIAQLHKVHEQWADHQARRSGGDFRSDPDAERFPELFVNKPPQAALTLVDLFRLWEGDARLKRQSDKTIADFRHKLDSLRKFLGHDDAAAVTRANIADWLGHLRLHEGLSAKTVRDKYRVAANSIYATAIAKGRLEMNPVTGTKVVEALGVESEGRGYTDAEALRVLSAANAITSTKRRLSPQTITAIRWLPWLCAFTGARVTEMAQARGRDLVKLDDVWCIRITPDAGSVKSRRHRTVPLHPQLIDMGFLAFAKASGDGPLFYTPKAAGVVDVTRAQSMGKGVCRWIREDMKITDKTLWPNHGWRHRFTTKFAVGGHRSGNPKGASGSCYGRRCCPLWRVPRQAVPRGNLQAASIRLLGVIIGNLAGALGTRLRTR